jgi:hypothetical protein
MAPSWPGEPVPLFKAHPAVVRAWRCCVSVAACLCCALISIVLCAIFGICVSV